jgi:hypothetical protein
VQANPSQLVRRAIQTTLRELKSPAAAIWTRIKKISALEVASHGFPVVNTLMSENLILRKSHGTYTVSDPFVPEAWQERKRLQEPP